MGIAERGKRYINVGFESGLFALGFGRGLGKIALKTTHDKFFAPPDPEHLIQTNTLHVAQLGIKAAHDGLKKNAPELQFFGEATAIRAVVQASHDEVTHPEVVEKIVEMVAEAGINPGLSPLVEDHEAEHAQELLH